VPDVVGVDGVSLAAAGESAAAVAGVEPAAQPAGWAPLRSADAGDGAVGAAHEVHGLGVARDASGRLRREAGSAVELADRAVIRGEDVGVDVDHHEVTVGG